MGQIIKKDWPMAKLVTNDGEIIDVTLYINRCQGDDFAEFRYGIASADKRFASCTFMTEEDREGFIRRL